MFSETIRKCEKPCLPPPAEAHPVTTAKNHIRRMRRMWFFVEE